MTAGLPRVGIAGIHGHGASHVRTALGLVAAGRAELAAVADPRPPASGPGEPVLPVSTAVFDDAAAMIDAADLDVVVLCTPIHTHLPLGLAAMEAGSHVLLEKPPTPTFADFEQLVAASATTGRAVQLGFQSLGSAGIAEVRRLVAEGAIGEVVRYGALGTWLRTEAYWTRAPWAGHRTLGGRPVADGAVTNPLAHAVATALAVAGADRSDDVGRVRLDLHRANDIEADDTSSFVVELQDRAPLAGALSLTAPRRSEPCVVVTGTRGRIVLWYTLDVVQVFADDGALPHTSAHPRVGLLENLLDHLGTGASLVAPAAATGGFMRVLEAVRTSEAPHRIPDGFVERRESPEGVHRVVADVERWSDRVLAEGRTFAELGAPWAVPASVAASVE
ncbi:Gfo/Idh/MocA family protein [Agromyces seonyuensis]|uniref:Gfo/Idh/MocA family oxidoreductase n=1 Tax=Agromyces seonyuensis TaxID=2662446 RepID=A0A6I4P341_9MICO|nr:Gfo/Idh/MocA family oxidoreductase [Agromyces seonyuensis]MWB97614.1 gfo/Idh/MocA family oxidoreductase [Agromyces seonyuensis]